MNQVRHALVSLHATVGAAVGRPVITESLKPCASAIPTCVTASDDVIVRSRDHRGRPDR